MKELADMFDGQIEINKINEIRIIHPDKEIHPQILFNYYTEIFGLGYNIKVNVI